MTTNNALSTICDLKWNYPIFNLERGEYRSCCRTPSERISNEDIEREGDDVFLNSKRQLESRKALVEGVRHSDCQSCWNLEDRGVKSPRHNGGDFWRHLQRHDIVESTVSYTDDKLIKTLSEVTSTDNPILRSHKPYMLEINMGNTCDLKCMYCSHHYSSQWAAELIKYGEITQQQFDIEFPKAPDKFNDAFWKWFNDTARYSLGRIGIIGGEPLIMPEFYVTMDKLIQSVKEINRTEKIKLWIVTNLNTPAQYIEKFMTNLPTLSEIFEVQVYVSMESTGKKAEYIRNGLKWDRFTKNIDTLLTAKTEKNLSFEFNFMPTINILSISDKLNFVKFVESLMRRYNMPIGITQNIVSFPDWQSPLILTSDFSKFTNEVADYMDSITDLPVVTDKYATWDAYSTYLRQLGVSIESHSSDDLSRKRRKFAEWFSTYDHRRKLVLLDVFPEYHEFYKLCEGESQ
jgi:sulfatase maturation enzyme AslB (radical SAM superfamily)